MPSTQQRFASFGEVLLENVAEIEKVTDDSVRIIVIQQGKEEETRQTCQILEKAGYAVTSFPFLIPPLCRKCYPRQ